MNRSAVLSLFTILLFALLTPIVFAAPGGTIDSPVNGALVSVPTTTFTINETLVQAAVTWSCIDTEIVQYVAAGTYTMTHNGLLVDGETCIITLSGFGPTGSLVPLPGGTLQVTVTVANNLSSLFVNAGPDITTNQTFTRSATATGVGSLVYSWSAAGPGLVTFSDDRSLTTDITAAVDGVYTIFLSVTDAAGNEAIDTFILTWNTTIVPPPVDVTPPVVNAGADVVTNRTFTRTAIATDPSTPITLSWSTSGPGLVSFALNPSMTTADITANTDGIYIITVTATDAAGNSANDSFTLTWDTTPPVVNAGADVTANTTATLTGTATDTLSGVATVLWAQLAGPPGIITFGTPGALTTSVSGTTAGVYTLTFTVTDAAGNAAEDSMLFSWTITTGPVPATPPNLTITNPITLANQNAVTITGDTVTAGTILWTIADALNASVNGSTAVAIGAFTIPPITVASLADGTLTLTVILSNGVLQSVPATLTTTKDTTPPTFTFTFPWTTTSGTDLITFTTGATGVLCSFDNGSWAACVNGVTTPTMLAGWAALPEGVITLFARATDAVGNPTFVSRVIIKNTLNATNLTNFAPVAVLTAPSSVVRGSSFTADASGSSDANIPGPLSDSLTFTFNFGDGTVFTGATTQMHSYGSTGTYSITLIVTDRFGLNATANRTITVTSSGSGGGGGGRRGGGGGLYVPPRTNATNSTNGTSSTSGSSGSGSNSQSDSDSETVGQGTNTAGGSNNDASALTGAIVSEDAGSGLSFAAKTIGFSLLGVALVFGITSGLAFLLRPRP